ncbi:hypothetical protein ACFWAZ_02485 [Streptomyces collinus]|uniref:hypothetical protein n=1 Tax=Streptomyces collinus TaxID=42684 RepID=UPI0036633074
MAADQLPAEVGEFVTYLDGLLARLDPSGGWCAVFWQRDPEGMRACLDGREMPPWDVVEALLRDLAGQYGPGGAGPETDRARALHAAALAAYDGRPGGRDALGDRLDVMLREQKYAAERQAALARHLTSATTREQADALRLDLAWARDDHERAVARCAELRARIAHLDRRDQGAHPRVWEDAAAGPSGAGEGYEPGAPWTGTGAADRHGAGDLGAGRRTPHHSTSRPAPWDAAGAATGPDALPASAVADAAGRYDSVSQAAGRRATEYPAGRTAPGEGAGAATGPDALSAPAVADVGRYDSVGQAAGRRATQYPVGRPVPGEAAGAATGPDALAAPAVAEAAGRYDSVGQAAGRRATQYPVGRTAPGEAAGAATGPDALAAPAVAEAAGRYDSVGQADRRHAPHHPASRPASGEAAAGGTPGGITAWGAAPAPTVPGAFGTPAAGSTPAAHGPQAAGSTPAVPSPSTTSTPAAPSPPATDSTPAAPETPTPKQRKRRRGGARFAGMVDEGAEAVAVPPAGVVPELPVPAPRAPGRTPRGARFAGVAEEAVAERTAPEAGRPGDAELAEVARTVDLLARLRGEGRSGEAHALLTEVASWEPARFPLLAERLHRAGLDADWQTLLWEAASLPAGRLVAAADALVAAGRAGDGQQMLRQGIARPPGEVGDAVLGLAAEGRHREVRVLLDAYVRARTPEEAARSAAPDPRRLVPLLLEAARGVSDERSWDLVHALRVAGYAA